MSDSRPAPGLAGLVRGRTPLPLAATPLLFVYFDLFLPVASAARFPPAVEMGAGIVLAAVSVTVFAVERRIAGARDPDAAAQLREFVGVVVGTALLAWALLRLPAAALIRSGEFWALIVAAGTVFALSAVVRRRTARQEFFVSAVARVARARREGPVRDAVAAATGELSVEAGESASALRSLRRWLIFFLVWTAALLIVIGWGLHVAGAVEQLGACFSTLVFLAAIVSVGRLAEEQRILTLGLLPAGEQRSVERGVAIILFASVALLAGVLALQPALVSGSVLAAVGSWLLWLFSRIPSHAGPPHAPPPPPRSNLRPPTNFAEQLQRIAPVHGSHLIGAILTYLAWGVAAAAAIALLWVLLAPLFRLERRRVSPLTALRAIAARTLEALHRWASELRGAVEGLREARGAGVLPAAAAARGRSVRRQRRRPRMTAIGARRFSGAFRRLATWGGDRGVPFATSLGPKEYATLLASRVPVVRPELELIAELYERQLFSPAPLSGTERASYFRTIKEVLSNGRS